MVPIAPRAPVNQVLRLAPNLSGRDFVVGDIHGAYDYVLQAMAQAQFDPACDRILSVGDLVDRGTGSWRCAKFLDQPYVHAVCGNHEAMLLDLYADGEPPIEALQWAASRNGLGWWLLLSRETQQEILERFARLPLAIELDTDRGLVGFAHADVPAGMAWPEFVAKLNAGDDVVTQTALWGRSRIHADDCNGVVGAGRVFVGHSPQWAGLKRLGNVYAVDTGAVFAELGLKEDGRLTFANVTARTCVLTAPVPHILVDVREDPAPTPGQPFGAYAVAAGA
jgi:serine/threonine protein phosphatase 1